MGALRVDITHTLRTFRLEVSLEVGAETVALVGPSGAGKTTILRAIAGLGSVEAGRIALDGDVWFDAAGRIDLPPDRRSVGLVFQEYALFPHMTVEQNIAYGSHEGATELLERFDIAKLAHARPSDLSGGERQRVALARALARNPSVLLLDEPLAALDAHTRVRVRGELRGFLADFALPTLFVTHDFDDAAALAERVGVISEGQVVQFGAPADLVAAPANPFVAEFTGSNLLLGFARPAEQGLTEVMLEDGARILSTDRAEGSVGMVVPPWEISLSREQPVDSMQNHVQGQVATMVPVSNRVRVRVGALTAEITSDSAERLELRPGETIVASFKATAARLVAIA